MAATRDSAKFRMADCIASHKLDPIEVNNCMEKLRDQMKADNTQLVSFFKQNYAKYC